LTHIDSKKESQFPKGNTNIRKGVETMKLKNGRKGKLKTNMKEKDELEKEARKGLDLERNVTTFP